ncbi:MAG: ribbon-helix-helix protein, CopG family, partial [Phycisphaerales bacterium JB065]
MPKTQISIKIDTDLLARVDKLAEEVGASRTAIIERAIHADLPGQEAFHRALENPVVSAVHQRITTPRMLKLIAALAREELSDEELQAAVDRAPQDRQAAK